MGLLQASPASPAPLLHRKAEHPRGVGEERSREGAEGGLPLTSSSLYAHTNN